MTRRAIVLALVLLTSISVRSQACDTDPCLPTAALTAATEVHSTVAIHKSSMPEPAPWLSALRRLGVEGVGGASSDVRWYSPVGSVCPAIPFDPEDASDAARAKAQCERESGKSCRECRGRGAMPAC